MTASRDTQWAAGVSDGGSAAGAGRKEANRAEAADGGRLSTARQVELLGDLQQLAGRRSADEARIAQALAEGLRAAEQARDKALAEIERAYVARRSQATTQYETTTAAVRSRYEQERDTAQLEYRGLREGVEHEHARVVEAARSATEEASWEALTVFDALKGRPRERYQAAVKRLERNNQELAVLERDAAAIMVMRRQWREFPPVEPGATDGQVRTGTQKAAQRVALGPTVAGVVATETVDSGSDAVEASFERLETLRGAVRDAAVSLERQKLPRLFEGGRPAGVFVLAWGLVAAPCALVLGWQNWWWIAASLGVAAVSTATLLAWLWPVARRRSGEQYRAVQQLLADARQAVRDTLREARLRGEREARALVAERDQQIAESKHKLHAIVHEREQWKEAKMSRAGQTYPQRLVTLRAELANGLATAKRLYAEAITSITEDRDRRAAENRQQYETRCRELRHQHERDWEALADGWRHGLAALYGAADRMRARCDRLFPNWETTEYAEWPRPAEPAPAIRFGRLTLDLKHIEHAMPKDPRLRPERAQLDLPALLTFDEHPVLLVTAEDEGRRAAIEVLQLAMLRMLTAMPPGKVRFTLLDPVGLGENFASFMHLADFDEQLVASRIWTDGRQIEEQLTRLSAHMETVLQKYLRNEFATIHEYNAQAGEVAEPFQVLVAANFPMNFSEAAARKLLSIATSGPRCGVYTLLMVDKKQKLPANFDLNDLKAGAVHLDWVSAVERQRSASEIFSDDLLTDGSLFAPKLPVDSSEVRPQSSEKGFFVWRYPPFIRMELELDLPPSPERMNDVIRAAGRAAKDSMRVEVPFEQVAPAEDQYWTGSCAKELVVPIGRAGARRLQSVRLGKGTSQHLLVAGKTGSGKSTFLHALVTNTALIYSPDEVEFYLIDFKKGVEFKTYAAHHLPHARVIAIESEREFGLSVLERLDQELKRRGDLFRAAGVQDLPDYRARVTAASRTAEQEGETRRDQMSPPLPLSLSAEGPSRLEGPATMPRILLIIDEFQELFVEDDKLAQDAALLLDRLVRQGRAFGIHVLLGSQTLSGAYSLARSTTGQMAVRVALQCSETDAHLILPDERNDAARFLSRPGEAIYNDQNGLLAGNHPFQVVWLPESQRIEYLKQIEAKSREQVPFSRDTQARRSGASVRETIVFEGDQPADPADNVKLRGVLERGPSGAPGAPQHAWLGAAVAIKDPTVATFGRHAGSNLLVVGAWDESALGVLTNAVVALAAQNRVGDFGFRISDRGLEKDMPNPQSAIRNPQFYVLDGTRPESPEAGTWQRVAEALPQRIEVGSQRDTARIINEVAVELARREAAGEDDAPPVYLVIFNGGRFRDLRRGEDDFSFSSDRDKPPSPDRQWAEILRNGPAWGVFTLLWCDSYNNVTRMMDRMMLREFEMRVAFQMSAADSSSFLDTPAASRLSPHRGLFASEDLGTLEKFRPYGVPTSEWLAYVMGALQAV